MTLTQLTNDYPHCISISNLVSVLWKLGKGPLHAHRVTRWKTNSMLKNKNANPISHVICRCFIQGFSYLSDTLDYFYVDLINQLFLLSTPHSSTHPIQMNGIRTMQWTNLSHANVNIQCNPWPTFPPTGQWLPHIAFQFSILSVCIESWARALCMLTR